MGQNPQSEFEELGEEEVRKRLAAHVWTASKERLARQWLELRDWSKSSHDAQQTQALAREANGLARSGNMIATIALIAAAIAIAISVIGLFLKK
jgi:hypothetical protein